MPILRFLCILWLWFIKTFSCFYSKFLLYLCNIQILYHKSLLFQHILLNYIKCCYRLRTCHIQLIQVQTDLNSITWFLLGQNITVSTCLERSKKMPIEAGEALEVTYLLFFSSVTYNNPNCSNQD